VDRLGRTRLKWYMYNEPERVMELYRSRKLLELEHQLASDLHQADDYIKILLPALLKLRRRPITQIQHDMAAFEQ
jgi:hypothetical protein